MKRFNIKIFVAGIIVLVGSTTPLISILITGLSGLDAIVLVALLTGFISIIGIVLKVIVESSQKTRFYLTEKREVPYREFLSIMYEIARGKASADDPVTLEKMWKVFENITLWGSDEVVKKVILYKEAANNNADAHTILLKVEAIIFEIRRDIGYSNIGLEEWDLLRIFLIDVDDVKKGKS